MNIIERNKEGFYTIDEELYISVTTALQCIYKKNLEAWKEKNLIKAALSAKKDATIEDILKESSKIKNKAAINGKETHKILEDARDLIDVSKYKKTIQPYLKSYNSFLKSLRFGVLARELICYSKEYKYAGTADLLIQTFFGETWLIDYKTSNWIHDTYQLQLSAYKQAIEEMGIINVDRIFVLQLIDEDNFKLAEARYDFESFKNVLGVVNWIQSNQPKFINKDEKNKTYKNKSFGS